MTVEVPLILAPTPVLLNHILWTRKPHFVLLFGLGVSCSGFPFLVVGWDPEARWKERPGSDGQLLDGLWFLPLFCLFDQVPLFVQTWGLMNLSCSKIIWSGLCVLCVLLDDRRIVTSCISRGTKRYGSWDCVKHKSDNNVGIFLPYLIKIFFCKDFSNFRFFWFKSLLFFNFRSLTGKLLSVDGIICRK